MNIYINVANVDLIGTYLNIVTNNNIDNKNLKAVKKRLLYYIAPLISFQCKSDTSPKTTLTTESQ